MKKLISAFFISILAVFTFQVVGLVPALAVDTSGVCDGIEFTGGSCDPAVDPNTGEPVDEIGGIVRTIINILSILVGVAAVIMIIIGGFKYITSAGDPAGAKGAKDTILYAIIGLVVVAMAQVIVRFVLTRVNSGA